MSVMDIEAAVRTTLTDDIVEKLIYYIAENGLKAGDMLPSEKQLTEAMGVSRLPLREALSRLKALGVISVRQGKGAVIMDVNVSNLFRQLSPIMRSQGNLGKADMIEVRLALEPSVARLAAIRRDEQALTHLEDCITRMESKLNDKADFIQQDMEYHQFLAMATGNPALDILVSTIHDIMYATQWGFHDSNETRQQSLEHHKRILKAVKAGDASGAAKAMEEHLNDVGANLDS